MDFISNVYNKLTALGTEDIPKSAPNYKQNCCEYKEDKYWTSDPGSESKIIFALDGSGSKEKVAPTTIPKLFELAVQKHGDKVALRSEGKEQIEIAEGSSIPPPQSLKAWKSWTYAQYYEDCINASKGIIRLGFEHHDCVCIFGFNSREWFIASMSAMLAGGKASGIYPTDNKETVQYKIDHSNASIVFVETKGEFEKVQGIIDHAPFVKAIVVWGFKPQDTVVQRSNGTKLNVIQFDELLKMGSVLDDGLLHLRISNQKPSHCCALVYTSGTTGRPKAVMISHDNLVYEISAILNEVLKSGVTICCEELRLLSYLPLSHIAGMMIDIIAPIVITVNTDGWVSTNFARPYDLKKGSLGPRIQSVEPSIFLGIPRVWEKMMEKLKKIESNSMLMNNTVFRAAKRRTFETRANMQLGGSGKNTLTFPFGRIIDMVKSKLGLAKCKFLLSAAAPLSLECLEYFASLNLNINELYGMSESTGVCTISTPRYYSWGAVGYQLDGCQVKIFKVKDESSKPECPDASSAQANEENIGEICCRGRNIMMGYMSNKRLGKEHVKDIEEKNATAIDSEGWFHSGDMGYIDNFGFLRVTGRLKDLIITAGGENIAPVPIESDLKERRPAISHVVMVGDRRSYNVALITLKSETSGDPEMTRLVESAAHVCNEVDSVKDAIESEEFISYILSGIEETNNNGEVIASRAAKIQKFTILPSDFTVDSGELTPTLKVKRSVIEDKHKVVIDAMYESTDMYFNYFTASA